MELIYLKNVSESPIYKGWTAPSYLFQRFWQRGKKDLITPLCIYSEIYTKR